MLSKVVEPMKSDKTVSLQISLSRPLGFGPLTSAYNLALGSLWSSILQMCPYHLSLLLLSTGFMEQVKHSAKMGWCETQSLKELLTVSVIGQFRAGPP